MGPCIARASAGGMRGRCRGRPLPAACPRAMSKAPWPQAWVALWLRRQRARLPRRHLLYPLLSLKVWRRCRQRCTQGSPLQRWLTQRGRAERRLWWVQLWMRP